MIADISLNEMLEKEMDELREKLDKAYRDLETTSKQYFDLRRSIKEIVETHEL